MSKSILKELAKYDFPDEIKAKANEIFLQINETRRKSKRTVLLFKCVYNAYIVLGKYREPIALGELMGLDSKKVKRCEREYNEARTGFSNNEDVDPVKLLEDYCIRLGFDSERTEDCCNFYVKITTKNPDILEKDPKKAVMAIFKYYLDLNGFEVPKETFKTTLKISEASISAKYKEVVETDNQK